VSAQFRRLSRQVKAYHRADPSSCIIIHSLNFIVSDEVLMFLELRPSWKTLRILLELICYCQPMFYHYIIS